MNPSSQLYRETFARWIEDCTDIALDSWDRVIDTDAPEWDELFQAGLSPRQAVGEAKKRVIKNDYH